MHWPVVFELSPSSNWLIDVFVPRQPIFAVQRLLSPMVSSRASGHNHIAVIRAPRRELAIGIHHGTARCPLSRCIDRRCRPAAVVRISLANVCFVHVSIFTPPENAYCMVCGLPRSHGALSGGPRSTLLQAVLQGLNRSRCRGAVISAVSPDDAQTAG